ncbi:MAG: hypothetical protein ACTSVW_00435 [Candidatus Njordarchaeales archaeon]
MGEIITLEGIKQLVRLKQEGKPLPVGWESLINEWFESKRRRIEFYEKRIAELKKDLEEGEKWLELLMK